MAIILLKYCFTCQDLKYTQISGLKLFLNSIFSSAITGKFLPLLENDKVCVRDKKISNMCRLFN